MDALKEKTGLTPGLAVVLVGNRTDSATYVRMKIKACEEVRCALAFWGVVWGVVGFRGFGWVGWVWMGGGSWNLEDTHTALSLTYTYTPTPPPPCTCPLHATTQVGIASFKTEFGEDVTEADLIAKVQELNNDPAVHGESVSAWLRSPLLGFGWSGAWCRGGYPPAPGTRATTTTSVPTHHSPTYPHQHAGILVQLPLPKHIHEQKVLDTILPDKDVDGLHPLNLAQLAHTK